VFARPDPAAVTAPEVRAAVIESLLAHAPGFAALAWPRAAIDDDDLPEFSDLLMNASFAPREVYLARVRARLTELDISSATRDRLERCDAFAPGLIVARGSMAPGARDATIARLLGHLIEYRVYPEWPELDRWVRGLDPAAREALIIAVIERTYATAETSLGGRHLFEISPERNLTRLLANLTDPGDLRRRATELNQRGVHWGKIVEALVRLSCAEHRAEPIHVDLAAREFIREHVLAAPTAGEMARRARQILGAPTVEGLDDELLRWIEPFARLNPSDAEIETFVSHTSSAAVLRAVLRWRREPPPADAATLLASLRKHFRFELTPFDRILIGPSLAPHFERVVTSGNAFQMGYFARTYLQESGDTTVHSPFLRRALAALTDLRDLALLFPPEDQTNGRLARRLPYLVPHLRATYARLDPAARRGLRQFYARSWPDLHPLLERAVGFAAARTAADFLNTLERWPLDLTAHRARHGGDRLYLTVEQMETFIDLKPTLEEYRRFLILSVEAREYTHVAAPLVPAQNLGEWTQPITAADGTTVIELEGLKERCIYLLGYGL
jgi:hypothetical protein